MEPVIYTLANGLRVLLIDTKAFPSVTTLLLVGAGSRYENKINNGIAHFFEHMAFKGSRKYPSAMAISTLLDSLGAVQNAFTSKDYTGYWIKTPRKYLETVLDVLAEMVLVPLLKTEEIEREKGVIVEEINMYEDQPQTKVWDLFETIIFPKNPLGYLTTGTKDTVSKFSRSTFLNYINSLYKPNNAVLIVAGGLGELGEIKSIVESKFGGWQKKTTVTFPKLAATQSKPNLLFHHKTTEQAHFVLGYRGLSRHDERKYVLNVLAVILGGGMSSRLFYELRERRGLCYYIHSGIELYEEAGYLYTRAGVNVSQAKIEQAISLILKEHAKIGKAEVKTAELAKAKEMIKGRTILALEDSFNLANFFGQKTLFNQKEHGLAEILKKIDSVSLDQIIEVARELITESNLNLALISPHKHVEIL